jgi:hypothetical protein
MARFRFNQRDSGRTWSNALFVLKTVAAAWSGADLIAVAEALAGEWSDQVQARQNPTTTLLNVVATDLTSTMGLEETIVAGDMGTFAGTHTSPLNCCFHAQWFIGHRYRGGHPGIRVSGIDQTQQQNAMQWSTAATTAMHTALTAVGAAIPAVPITGGPGIWVSPSYFTGGALRVVPLVLPVTGIGVQERVCSARKRLGKSIAEL